MDPADGRLAKAGPSKISAAAVQPEEVSAPGRSGRAMVYMLTSRRQPWADYRAGTRAELIIVWGTIETAAETAAHWTGFADPAATILNVWKRREDERGYQIVAQAPVPRHFTAPFAPP